MKAYGLGGDRSPANIVLACGPHNLYLAELDYGKELMERYRRSADVAREPSPTYGLRAGDVSHPPPTRFEVVRPLVVA